MAYAELAGMPPWHGLYAAAMAPILAAPFVSSRYLQTGPVALTCLLTTGALAGMAGPATAEYVGLAAVLALIVGVTRLAIGLLRMGGIAWLMSQPVLQGFTLAAALLILASQLPAALGIEVAGDSVLERGWTALTHPSGWSWGAVAISVVTIALMRGGKYIHARFPGVLIAAGIGLGASVAGLPVGATLGDIPAGLPPLIVKSLPWASLPSLILPGIVIALIGFAEAAAIARTFATEDRESWDPNREFVSQGVANLAAGVFGGFPVGGSFSRSSLARISGARTRWAGAVTGLAVLAVLPFAHILAPLPRAILGATVVGAIVSLLDPRPTLAIWSRSRAQATIAWTTFAATLVTAPHIERGVLIGVGIAIGVHLWREMEVEVPIEFDGRVLRLRPVGVLWFGTAAKLEQGLIDAVVAHASATQVIVDLSRLGRVDYSGAVSLERLVNRAREGGLDIRVVGVPRHARQLIPSGTASPDDGP
jgi:SulP family sulfate permease